MVAEERVTVTVDGHGHVARDSVVRRYGAVGRGPGGATVGSRRRVRLILIHADGVSRIARVDGDTGLGEWAGIGDGADAGAGSAREWFSHERLRGAGRRDDQDAERD
jgi:hypothetical protein